VNLAQLEDWYPVEDGKYVVLQVISEQTPTGSEEIGPATRTTITCGLLISDSRYGDASGVDLDTEVVDELRADGQGLQHGQVLPPKRINDAVARALYKAQ
jgi:hypothetical protein